MSKKVIEALDNLDKAIDQLSALELENLLVSSGVNQKISSYYAHLERHVITYCEYEGTLMSDDNSYDLNNSSFSLNKAA